MYYYYYLLTQSLSSREISSPCCQYVSCDQWYLRCQLSRLSLGHQSSSVPRWLAVHLLVSHPELTENRYHNNCFYSNRYTEDTSQISANEHGTSNSLLLEQKIFFIQRNCSYFALIIMTKYTDNCGKNKHFVIKQIFKMVNIRNSSMQPRNNGLNEFCWFCLGVSLNMFHCYN